MWLLSLIFNISSSFQLHPHEYIEDSYSFNLGITKEDAVDSNIFISSQIFSKIMSFLNRKTLSLAESQRNYNFCLSSLFSPLFQPSCPHNSIFLYFLITRRSFSHFERFL